LDDDTSLQADFSRTSSFMDVDVQTGYPSTASSLAEHTGLFLGLNNAIGLVDKQYFNIPNTSYVKSLKAKRG
jgi:hypothetical protein